MEVVECAGATGSINILVKEIVNQGQSVRNQVEQRLKSNRLEEELILKLVVLDAEREERLRDTVRKRAAWKKRFAWIESERLSTRMERLAIED